MFFATDLAAGVSARAVPHVTFPGRAEVDGDDVSVSYDPFAGYAVDHLVVDGNAGRRGKAFKVEAARYGALGGDVLVHGPVDLFGGEPVAHGLSAYAPGAGGDLARLTHQLDFSAGFDGDHHSPMPRALKIAALTASMLPAFSTERRLPSRA